MKGAGLPRVLIGVCLMVFAVSTAGMLMKLEPFYSKYYFLAWWPYIIGAQSWLRLKGGPALMHADPGRFFFLAFLSVPVWLVFEMFNFRLGNWHYINLPANELVRRAGYFVAFATVIPGIITTRDLLAYFRVFEGRTARPLREARKAYPVCLVLGVFMLISPLAWPKYCFPLVWGSFVFLLEPYVHKHGGRSFLADFERGDPVPFYRTLLAGAVCGGLWEMWNYLAGAKWIYTVPFVGDLKLFEMPVAGFLGFPPFAVECMVMVSAWDVFWERQAARPGFRSRLLGAGFVVAALLFDWMVFIGIDRFTVASFAFRPG